MTAAVQSRQNYAEDEMRVGAYWRRLLTWKPTCSSLMPSFLFTLPYDFSLPFRFDRILQYFLPHLLTKEALYEKKVSNIVPHTVGKLRLSAFQWCMSWNMLFESISRNKHICNYNPSFQSKAEDFLGPIKPFIMSFQSCWRGKWMTYGPIGGIYTFG